MLNYSASKKSIQVCGMARCDTVGPGEKDQKSGEYIPDKLSMVRLVVVGLSAMKVIELQNFDLV